MPGESTGASTAVSGSDAGDDGRWTDAEDDLYLTVVALDEKRWPGADAADTSTPAPRGVPWLVKARRPFALTVLAALLIAALVAADRQLLTTGKASRADSTSAAINTAVSGDCLTWPAGSLERASRTSCSEPHRFEVVESVGMSAAHEQCQSAVQRYLGSHFDPNGRFTAGMLWSGASGSDGRLLCGLQLPGPGTDTPDFTGRVADIDQSKVWPAGTCLGLDPAGQANDSPVDCASPHAVEVTGTVNLREKFGDPWPSEADQIAFLSGACAQVTNIYVAQPVSTPPLAAVYSVVARSSWSAGSREVPCEIGMPSSDGVLQPMTGRLGPSSRLDQSQPVISAPIPHAPPSPSSPVQAAPTVAQPPPTQSPAAPSPSPTAAAIPASAPPSPSAPPPAPSPPSATSEPDSPPVILIPGLPPITLPVAPPPAPAD